VFGVDRQQRSVKYDTCFRHMYLILNAETFPSNDKSGQQEVMDSVGDRRPNKGYGVVRVVPFPSKIGYGL